MERESERGSEIESRGRGGIKMTNGKRKRRRKQVKGGGGPHTGAF